jgi:hypothetical protein
MRLIGAAVIVVVVVGVLLHAANRAKRKRLTRSGLYPDDGEGTDADVERLVSLGHEIQSVKLFSEIHGVDLRTAREAVERTRRGLGRRGPIRRPV